MIRLAATAPGICASLTNPFVAALPKNRLQSCDNTAIVRSLRQYHRPYNQAIVPGISAVTNRPAVATIRQYSPRISPDPRRGAVPLPFRGGFLGDKQFADRTNPYRWSGRAGAGKRGRALAHGPARARPSDCRALPGDRGWPPRPGGHRGELAKTGPVPHLAAAPPRRPRAHR